VVTAAVDEVLRNVQEATAAHEVSFLDTDVDVNGGKILLVGGAPSSAGDDTDRLLTAVSASRQSGRAGCHCRPAYRKAGYSQATPVPNSPYVFGKGRCRKSRRSASRSRRVRHNPRGSGRARAHASVIRGE
jgi:hypothetical protein